MKSILFFNKMYVPEFITFVYWLALVLTVIGSIGMMSQNVLMGILSLIGGLVATRFGFEMLLVVFKINESLKTIAENTQPK